MFLPMYSEAQKISVLLKKCLKLSLPNNKVGLTNIAALRKPYVRAGSRLIRKAAAHWLSSFVFCNVDIVVNQVMFRPSTTFKFQNWA